MMHDSPAASGKDVADKLTGELKRLRRRKGHNNGKVGCVKFKRECQFRATTEPQEFIYTFLRRGCSSYDGAKVQAPGLPISASLAPLHPNKMLTNQKIYLIHWCTSAWSQNVE